MLIDKSMTQVGLLGVKLWIIMRISITIKYFKSGLVKF